MITGIPRIAIAVTNFKEAVVTFVASGGSLAHRVSSTNATPDERRDYELPGGGEGIHWPQLDEDLSVAGLLSGNKDS